MNSQNPVNGSTYLVLGIVSLVVCPFLGPVAWRMSNNALDDLNGYEMNGGDVSQRGLVEAGRLCGMIGTAFLALGLCLALLRGCAEMAFSPEYREDSNTTITINGHHVSPETQKEIDAQIKALENNPPAHQKK